MKEGHTALRIERGEDFVLSSQIENICQRGLAYLEAGYPVHLTGQAGTGKTTLALHLASLLGRPVMLVYGDEEYGSSDLLGGNTGIVSRRMVDNFIHSVLKTEESTRSVWVDERLAIACKNGYTLVYDEFSRSRAEANNVLLSILEEGILALPNKSTRQAGYIKVHPDFRAILTSNPDEYAGVYTPQSALLDRMVTIKLDYYDRETEIAIVQSKSGLPREEAVKIVDIVRTARKEVNTVTIRSGIAIGRILVNRKGRIRMDDPAFMESCADVFGLGMNGNGRVEQIVGKALGVEAAAG